MRKGLVFILLGVVGLSVGGCGKQTPDTASVNAVTPSAVVVTGEANVIDAGEYVYNEDGEDTNTSGNPTVLDAYTGRKYVGYNLPHLLVQGENVSTMGATSAEKSYFGYLEEYWIDSSWYNESLSADDMFHEDVFVALNNGLYEKLTGTIASYTEVEQQMQTVYSDINHVENEINEDYAIIAICDMAGFNGVNFNNSTTKDSVCRGVVIDMANIFAHDNSFRQGIYADYDAWGDTNFTVAATGYDFNYALAKALGLDTADASTSLTSAGYIACADVSSLSLLEYDRLVFANAQVYASIGLVADTINVEQVETTEVQRLPGFEDIDYADVPTDIGKTVVISGESYVFGGTTEDGIIVDDPAYYNHPEAAIMNYNELSELGHEDILWLEDANIRADRWDAFLFMYGNIM